MKEQIKQHISSYFHHFENGVFVMEMLEVATNDCELIHIFICNNITKYRYKLFTVEIYSDNTAFFNNKNIQSKFINFTNFVTLFDKLVESEFCKSLIQNIQK